MQTKWGEEVVVVQQLIERDLVKMMKIFQLIMMIDMEKENNVIKEIMMIDLIGEENVMKVLGIQEDTMEIHEDQEDNIMTETL